LLAKTLFEVFLGENMKKWFFGGLSLIAVCIGFLGFTLAQSSPNESARAVLALCSAVGVPEANRITAPRCVQYLQSLSVIDASTSVILENAIEKNNLTNCVFAVFLADLINELQAAPKNATEAGKYLAEKGIDISTSTCSALDGEDLRNITTGTALAAQARGLRLRLSPSRP
jgi:hypothetical protein